MYVFEYHAGTHLLQPSDSTPDGFFLWKIHTFMMIFRECNTFIFSGRGKYYVVQNKLQKRENIEKEMQA